VGAELGTWSSMRSDLSLERLQQDQRDYSKYKKSLVYSAEYSTDIGFSVYGGGSRLSIQVVVEEQGENEACKSLRRSRMNSQSSTCTTGRTRTYYTLHFSFPPTARDRNLVTWLLQITRPSRMTVRVVFFSQCTCFCHTANKTAAQRRR
jgi:hypothetical protein